jgi:hypothetical protein
LGWHAETEDRSAAPAPQSHDDGTGANAGLSAPRALIDSGVHPSEAVPPGSGSVRTIRPSPHRILAKDPEGNWPESLLLNALDVAKGHVPTAARILGISRSQAYRLYKQLRGREA